MKKSAALFSLIFVTTFGISAQKTGVQAKEGTLDLPTYVLGKPEVAPIFERDWSYQRARRSVYPYVLDDNMTRDKKTISYKAVYLENEYIELCVLPEIGGRLFYAIDKTNNYDIFYRNHVVKPGNVGMLGAWISGGVEWNAFHHHRNTTNTPCDYKIVENPDGSKTIWVGETELRHRMSWAIGITLYPGKSYMEISGRLINSTQDNNSMLYWSNVATHVDENYQIIFPQSVEFGTFHCKNSFSHWPVTKEPFNGIEEYAKGIDASWWRNHFMSNSIFIYDQKEDFIAGYDHGRKAGTMITANHHIVKGGKFWLWGPNSEWDSKILTDDSGHYCELMVGAYSDNQPDYNWSNPYEVKRFTHYLYGVRDIEGVKTGNRHAALNLELKDKGRALMGVNVTEKMSGATVALSARGKSIFSETLDIAPDKPFVKNMSIDQTIVKTELTMTVTDSQGKLVLSYTPVVNNGADKPLPDIVDKPLLPHQIENTEECFFVGLRNLQFHNPFINPVNYFEEVLRRDPGDTRANTQMGIWWRRHGDNKKAADYLRRAIKRQTKDYTRPKDCEAMYNLGLILKEEGNILHAMDTLYRAVWNYSYNSPGNYQLAQIYVALGNYEMAIDRLNEALVYNADNFNALNLKTTVLRQQGKNEEALKCADLVLAGDPLNAYATCEKGILSGDNFFRTLMRDNMESYMELAIQYMHNSSVETTVELLKYIDAKGDYPIVKMWLGYLADKEGDKITAKDYYAKAVELPTDYCHPFRLETVAVLNKAKEYCPESAKPYYYMGNLMYDKQPEIGMSEWKKCLEIDPGTVMAWRNLGWANWLYTKDYDEAVNCYRKAVELDPNQVLILEELDQVCEVKGEDVRKRFELLKSLHHVAVKRYNPLVAEVQTGIFLGEYDYVLDLLKNCYFPTREGIASFHDIYVDAMLLAGKKKFEDGAQKEAIKFYEESFLFPENHQVFLVDERSPHDAQAYYYIADAYRKIGQKSKATAYYKKAAAVNSKKTDYRYWQALALQQLGKKVEAGEIFKELVNAGNKGLVDSYVNFYGAEGTTGKTVALINAGAYYTIGLGELGLGNKSKAKESFEKSLKLKPDHLWSMTMLKEL